MSRRIILWALFGFAIASAWVVYSMLSWPNMSLDWRWVAFSAPACLLGRHRPQSFYEFIALNTAMYACVGFVLEIALKLSNQTSSKRYRYH